MRTPYARIPPQDPWPRGRERVPAPALLFLIAPQLLAAAKESRALLQVLEGLPSTGPWEIVHSRALDLSKRLIALAAEVRHLEETDRPQ